MKIMWMKMTSFISKSKQGYLVIMNSLIVWVISFGAIGLLSQCEGYDVELKEEHTSCPIMVEDRDGDCSLNAEDAFPDDPIESKDTDSDGIGDNADFDDDGDLVQSMG